METLTFTVNAQWAGTGREGEGTLTLGGQPLRYSAPTSMGGKGVGASPEDLLVAAVTACYSGTLFRVLTQERLPAVHIAVTATGTVEGYPTQTRYSRLMVSPTIVGGDPARLAAYERAAARSRDLCFIGKTVRDYLDYVVGPVTVRPTDDVSFSPASTASAMDAAGSHDGETAQG
jgi:peroxiredoxin-like protein